MSVRLDDSDAGLATIHLSVLEESDLDVDLDLDHDHVLEFSDLRIPVPSLLLGISRGIVLCPHSLTRSLTHSAKQPYSYSRDDPTVYFQHYEVST